MKDEARALEHKKREEAKAEQAIRAAEVCSILLQLVVKALLSALCEKDVGSPYRFSNFLVLC